MASAWRSASKRAITCLVSIPAVLFPPFFASSINEYAPHGPGGSAEKMSCVLPIVLFAFET
jgi:hypothetical protein